MPVPSPAQLGTIHPTDASTEHARQAAQALDRWLHVRQAPLTAGLSPVALALASADWWLNLAHRPGHAAWLGLRAWQLAVEAGTQAWLTSRQAATDSAVGGTTPASGRGPLDPEADPRFAHPVWRQGVWPLWVQAQQAQQAWWAEATAMPGMSPHHREMTGFLARQWLDATAPSNAGLANPEVLQRTLASGGANLLHGAARALDEWRQAHGLPPLAHGTVPAPVPEPAVGQPSSPARPYQPGVDVAITPGKVVHRNALVELIQYLPTTPRVQAEPVLIVPSWIMKYYILDLSPHNSLVRWLVSQGHTVFILSWRNPDESDALLSMDDYLALGIFDGLAAIGRQVPGQAVHAAGYCLGGTLLALAAAALARPQRVDGAESLAPLASVSLLAAETDFSEPGEMGVLIDEAQVAMLEDQMAERGFLTGPQMAGSFAYLHSRELVWTRRLRTLWLDEPDSPNDLMAWNADTTRMPALMHSQYLRRCYLHNDIANGRFPVGGQPVALKDVDRPMFVVATEKDHVSPWKSVYKIHALTDNALSFVLTNGGHNAGIVSEPGHANRRHALQQRQPGDAWCSPEDWLQAATWQAGSWWPTWHAWLLAQGSGKTVKARTPAAADVLGDAPGLNVQVRYSDPVR